MARALGEREGEGERAGESIGSHSCRVSAGEGLPQAPHRRMTMLCLYRILLKGIGVTHPRTAERACPAYLGMAVPTGHVSGIGLGGIRAGKSLRQFTWTLFIMQGQIWKDNIKNHEVFP